MQALGYKYISEEGSLIDMLSGCYNVPLGHSSDLEVQAFKTLGSYSSSTYGRLEQFGIELEAKLNDALAQDRSWRTYSSGAEVVERAIMLSLKPGGTLVCFEGAFHGKSFMSAKFAYDTWWNWPFNVVKIPVGRLDLLPEKFDAIIYEPIQGQGGGWFSDIEQAELRAACDRVGAMLIADEVFCGLGRTGVSVCSRIADPDILLIGKGLAGSLPIAALGIRNGIELVEEVGISSTFFNNHIPQQIAIQLVEATIRKGVEVSPEFEKIYNTIFPEGRAHGSIAFIPKNNIKEDDAFVLRCLGDVYKFCPSYCMPPNKLSEYLRRLRK